MTILDHGARLLDRFDPDLVNLLVRCTREPGVGVEVDARAVEAIGDCLLVRGVQRRAERTSRPTSPSTALGPTLGIGSTCIGWAKRPPTSRFIL